MLAVNWRNLALNMPWSDIIPHAAAQRQKLYLEDIKRTKATPLPPPHALLAVLEGTSECLLQRAQEHAGHADLHTDLHTWAESIKGGGKGAVPVLTEGFCLCVEWGGPTEPPPLPRGICAARTKILTNKIM